MISHYCLGTNGLTVVHHNIHAGKLRPDLSEETNVGTVDHARTDQLEVGDIGSFTLEVDPFLDFIVLVADNGSIWVTFAVSEDQDSLTLFPAVFGC